MKSVLAIAGLMIALGGGYFVYQTYLSRSPMAQVPPQEQIDVIDIRANLISIGQAEKMYVYTHGSYGTLDQLRADGSPSLGTDVRGYVFSVSPNGAQSFTATATQTSPNRSGWPTLVIDETMQVRQQ